MEHKRYFISQESGDQMGGASPYLHGPFATRKEAEETIKKLRATNSYDDFFLLSQEQEA